MIDSMRLRRLALTAAAVTLAVSLPHAQSKGKFQFDELVEGGAPIQVIGFRGLPAGLILDEVYSDLGQGPIRVFGKNPAQGNVNTAVVFDSANPTGEDEDLGTPNEDFGGPGEGSAGEIGSPFVNDKPLGNLLIVSEDLTDANNDMLVDDPDDSDRLDSELLFDFQALSPVRIGGVTVIDVEPDEPFATVQFIGEEGRLLASFDLPEPGDNGVVAVGMNQSGVHQMVIRLNGSGAIDNILYLPENDCNENGVPDAEDISTGTSLDCNLNGIPDECEPDCDLDGIPDDCEEDCDSNGTPDDCEDFADCNSNGIPDSCDIDSGDSSDANMNGVPDECELDCNRNGIPDSVDISSGTSQDCNENGIPDECEPDCDLDGVPDDCESDCDANGTPDDCETFTDCNGNDVPDSCDIDSGTSLDCNLNGIPDECEADCDADGIPDDCEDDCDGDGTPDDCEMALDCNGNGIPDTCDIANGDSLDSDGNGVPDECEDCDGDGTPDDLEPDCDGDGTPDDCEPDCDGNGTPDDCEPDCDNDGTPDGCEPDCDGDGTPDDCEPDCDADGTPDDCEDDCNGNGIPDDCEACADSAVVLWDLDHCMAFGHAAFFHEFIGTTLGGCSNVELEPGIVEQKNGIHSCTNDAETGEPGDAMCVAADPDLEFDLDDPQHVVRVELDVTETEGQVASLETFRFWQLAGWNYVVTDEFGYYHEAKNNPPAFFGLRVLRDGVEVFFQEDLPTPKTWSESVFSFAGDPDFEVTGETVKFTFEMAAYAPIPNGGLSSIWDLDELSVTICCAAGGSPGDCDGDGVPDFCETDTDGDGIPDDCEAQELSSTFEHGARSDS